MAVKVEDVEDNESKQDSNEPAVIHDASNLVWMDCEMTGLDSNVHHLCEVAVLVTDKDLKMIVEGPSLVIHLEDEVLADMDAWCSKEFTKSGLIEEIKASKVSMESAQSQLLSLIQKYVPKKKGVLCGNSISEDKRFLSVDMPEIVEYLHYRIVDVTSIKELAKRWYPDILEKRPKKSNKHRAMDDIKESIKELQFYRDVIFVNIQNL